MSSTKEIKISRKVKIKTSSRILRVCRWMAVSALVPLLLVIAAWLALPLVPLPDALFDPPPAQLEFLDRNGHPLRAVRADDGPFRGNVEYAEIPTALIQATLAAEDRRYWSHPGVDWRATMRAACQCVIHRRVVSGASTVTQQLIKIAQPRPRTLKTKVIEAVQALRLEQLWSKQRILCEYLNRLDYGNFNQGCQTAARFYFATPLRDLSPAQCAFLAALPQAPTRLNPENHFDRASNRQQWILRQMKETGWLADEDFERAIYEPLRLSPPHRAFEAPHFVDLLLQSAGLNSGIRKSSPFLLRRRGERGEEAHQESTPVILERIPGRSRCGPSSCARGSSTRQWASSPQPSPPEEEREISTTLDLDLNHFAEGALRHHLAGLRRAQARDAAAVVLDNRTGDVLALVGSEDYFAPGAGQVNGAWAPRSAGSTFKPFTYLLAFERGDTAASVVADVPTEFATASGIFAPVNYNRHCYGPMRYRVALANSLNISAVKVLASVGGPEPLLARLQACGLTTLNRLAQDYGLGLTIGNAEARLLELANAYACLARLGEYRPYRLILERGSPEPPQLPTRRRDRIRSERTLVHSHAAGEDTRAPTASRRVADPLASWLIADVLSDNEARTLAFGPESPLRFNFPVACKTGTSSDFRDNWAFGFTPEFTVGVWVGNFDGAPMHGVSGVTGAGPILHEIFQRLHDTRGTSWYPVPLGITACEVVPITGRRCKNPKFQRDCVQERFISSAPPPVATAEDYDSEGRVRLGIEYRDWLASADNRLSGRAVLAESTPGLRITFPSAGAIFYLDPDLPAGGARLPLRAQGPPNIQWKSDSLKVEPAGDREFALLTPGPHRITARDPLSGVQAETWFEVRER